MRVKLFPTIKNKVSNVFAIAFISIFCVTVMLAGEQPNKVGIKSKIEFDKGINACPTITAATATSATCTGTTANNNASISVSATIADKAGYSAGLTYTGVAYASATALVAGSVTFGSLANPSGGQAYTLRVFNGNTCYKDTTIILKSTVCYAMCSATNLVQNSSFENGAFAPNANYVDVNNAMDLVAPTVPGALSYWLVDGGKWIQDSKRASDQSRFVEMTIDYACWANQFNIGTGALDICNGSTYELCYDYAFFEPTDPNNTVVDNTEMAIELVNYSNPANLQVFRLIGNGGIVGLKDATSNTVVFSAGTAVIRPTASWDDLRYGIRPHAQSGWHRVCGTITMDFSAFYFSGPLTKTGFAFTKLSGKDMLLDNIKLTKCAGVCVPPPTITNLAITAATCTGATPNNNATVAVTASSGDKVGISGGSAYWGASYASLTTSLSGGTYTFSGLTAAINVPGDFYTIRVYNGNAYSYKDTTILIPFSNCANRCIMDQFHYATPQLVDVPWGGTNPVSAASAVLVSTTLGGERDVLVTRIAGGETVKLDVASWDPGVAYVYMGYNAERGTITLTYDGVDNNANTINYTTLGAQNMSSGVFNVDLMIDGNTPFGIVNATIKIYSSATNWSYKTLPVNTAGAYVTLTFDPATFTVGGGTGANSSSIVAVQLITGNTVAGTGWRLRNFFRPCTVGSVGNYVWNDTNSNGINDEPTTAGINGVTVQLWNATTNTLVATTTTANNGANPGYYNFVITAGGNYYVKFPTTNSSKTITIQTIAAATDNNSDANVTTGCSPIFAIDLNTTGVAKDNPTIDCGYSCPTTCTTVTVVKR